MRLGFIVSEKLRDEACAAAVLSQHEVEVILARDCGQSELQKLADDLDAARYDAVLFDGVLCVDGLVSRAIQFVIPRAHSHGPGVWVRSTPWVPGQTSRQELEHSQAAVIARYT